MGHEFATKADTFKQSVGWNESKEDGEGGSIASSAALTKLACEKGNCVGRRHELMLGSVCSRINLPIILRKL